MGDLSGISGLSFSAMPISWTCAPKMMLSIKKAEIGQFKLCQRIIQA